MGNSSSQSTLPQQAAGRKKPLAVQTVDRADVVTGDGSDDESPRNDIPRNSFCSRLIVRNGNWIVIDPRC